jgi:predicted nucleic acid-binding protein
MSEVFADTSYFVALLGKDVSERQRAVEVMAGRDETLLTTAWVLVELGNFMSQAHHRRAFVDMARRLHANPKAVVLQPDARLYNAGMRLYEERPDKDWSLTDCISFVAMGERNVPEALTTDHHFEQAGFAALLR